MKILKSLSKIGLIALIIFAFVSLTNVSFAQNKVDNKQTIVKQDTIVVKSLEWNDEYKKTGATKEEWEELGKQINGLEDQKALLRMSNFNAEKAFHEQAERARKENEEFLKQKSVKNDTIQKKK